VEIVNTIEEFVEDDVKELRDLLNEHKEVFYCSECRDGFFEEPLKNTNNACCLYRKCDYCGEVRIVNVLGTGHTFVAIPLDKDGFSVERYVEREGV
jgi:hypothetical protein